MYSKLCWSYKEFIYKGEQFYIMESNKKILKISINDIRPNMVLAADVVTKSGAVILAKNTMLNNVNFTKLKSNEITSIKVWDQSYDKNADVLTHGENTIEEQMKPITSRPEYKQFSGVYESKIDNAKETLLAIGDGGEVDVDELYGITTDIVNTVNCKSDIFAYMLSLKDIGDHTYTHSINVSLLCNLFSKWMGMSEEEGKILTIAGILHDIGKTKVPHDVLNKKEKLTDAEFEEIKRHPTYGYEMVVEKDIPEEVKMAVLMHHEKMDGSGYPMGIKGTKITKFAKIVAICDIYDAMTSDRVYRSKICPFEVIRNFEESSFGLLDTEYLLVFLQNIAYTYVGSWVKLSNGENAEIVFINRGQMSRPIVKSGERFLDLSKIHNIDIEYII